MTEEVIDKDVSIVAYPEKNEAHCFGNTADGFIFAGSAKDAKIISGDEVNETIAILKEKGLTYSFKKGD